jgi:hypothetical protein
MNRFAQLTLALLLPLALGACEATTDKTDAGGVLLTVSDYDMSNLTVETSVNATTVMQAESITLSNTPKNISAPTSALMDVNLLSYEVTFTRADNGTRIPVPLVRGIGGTVPVGGTTEIGNLTLLDRDQLRNAPLSDLLFANGGTDSETGEHIIVLNCSLRFFGRTLSGDEVESAPFNFSFTFTP